MTLALSSRKSRLEIFSEKHLHDLIYLTVYSGFLVLSTVESLPPMKKAERLTRWPWELERLINTLEKRKGSLLQSSFRINKTSFKVKPSNTYTLKNRIRMMKL